MTPTVRCRACERDVVPGRFCSNCGLALPLVGRTDARCATCGAALADGARFCTDCGNPVPRSPRP